MKSVLIVDDSRFARLTLRRIVEANFPDWYISEAADGAEALVILAEIVAEIALVDFNMPGDDGITVADKILAKHPDTRIAILTANVQDAVAERARRHGLQFMRKPAKEAEVVAFLKGI